MSTDGATRKCILVVSDLHCGSIFGMLPPGFVTSDGAPKLPNAGQKHLWECWHDLTERVKHLPIQAIVVNGDSVDGKQSAQLGTELALPVYKDQSRAAAQCLLYLQRKIKSKPPFFVIQGTEYHDDKAGGAAEAVAEAIKATAYRGLGTGVLCREVLDLEIDGVIGNFAHGIGVSAGLYRATAPDREGVWSALCGKEGKFPKADYVIRSHAHYFVHVEHASKHVTITPCWELQTRFMRKNGPYRMVPDIGAVLVWLDPDLKRRGDDPVEIQKILYPLPKIGTTRLQ